MKDIELQAARSAFEAWMRVEHPGVDLSRRVDGSYWSSTPDSFFDGFLGAWNRRAAVEADRAQRVPDGWLNVLEDFEKKERSPFQAYLAAGLANELRAALLASTPAPAQGAQRVPDGAISGALFDFAGFLTTLDAPVRFGSTEDAAPMVELLQEFAKKRGLSLDDADVMCWSALLASTPAPAQQEPAKPMDAHRAAYFMRRFLHEEKMLGPNEQAALHFTIAALEAMESAAQHQEPPQQERKPMTDDQDRALCEAFCNAASDEYFKARPQLDSDVNRRIFYAGHRKAWLEWQTAHGIKE